MIIQKHLRSVSLLKPHAAALAFAAVDQTDTNRSYSHSQSVRQVTDHKKAGQKQTRTRRQRATLYHANTPAPQGIVAGRNVHKEHRTRYSAS
jgi:hypothetical protein